MDTTKKLICRNPDPGFRATIEMPGEELPPSAIAIGIEPTNHVIAKDVYFDDAAELVRRWNHFPALVEALEGLVQTIEFQAEANFLNEDADEGEENALTRARAALKAASE